MVKGTLLHLVEYLEQGGVERLLEQLTIKQSRLRPVMIYTYETPEPAGIGKDIASRGIPVIFDKKSPGFDLRLLLRLIRTVRTEKITAIHTHDFGPILYAVLTKVFFPRLRLIHTQHTLQNLVSNRKYCFSIQICRLFFQRFIAVSNQVKTSLEKKSPLLRGFIETIPNGVDTDAFLTVERSEESKTLSLLSVSRISREKNIWFSIAVCHWLKTQGIKLSLTHVGSGPEDYQYELNQLVRDLGLDQQISFVGFQSDVRPYFERADLFLSSSLTEGMPVSVLEAMSCGKPCVLSDIEAHRSFSHSLVRVSPLNVSIFGASILDLWNGRSSWKTEATNLHEYVEKSFSLSRMVENYERCYA